MKLVELIVVKMKLVKLIVVKMKLVTLIVVKLRLVTLIILELVTHPLGSTNVSSFDFRDDSSNKQT